MGWVGTRRDGKIIGKFEKEEIEKGENIRIRCNVQLNRDYNTLAHQKEKKRRVAKIRKRM